MQQQVVFVLTGSPKAAADWCAGRLFFMQCHVGLLSWLLPTFFSGYLQLGLGQFVLKPDSSRPCHRLHLMMLCLAMQKPICACWLGPFGCSKTAAAPMPAGVCSLTSQPLVLLTAGFPTRWVHLIIRFCILGITCFCICCLAPNCMVVLLCFVCIYIDQFNAYKDLNGFTWRMVTVCMTVNCVVVGCSWVVTAKQLLCQTT